MTVINPTSVHNKEDLVVQLQAQLVFASETSAVQRVQISTACRLRQSGFSCVWGNPVHAHLSAKTGLDTLRGHAAGVAVFGTLPLSSPCVPLAEEALATLRIVEAMTRLGNVQTRLPCLYGFPANYRDAHNVIKS